MAKIGKIKNGALEKWRKNRIDEKTGDEKTGWKCMVEIGKNDGALKKWRKTRIDEKPVTKKPGSTVIYWKLVV